MKNDPIKVLLIDDAKGDYVLAREMLSDIRQRESLPNPVTLRFQVSSFNTFRTFLAYSPELKSADSFIAYEGSRTDGPFINPLRYRRDNLTANYSGVSARTRH